MHFLGQEIYERENVFAVCRSNTAITESSFDEESSTVGANISEVSANDLHVNQVRTSSEDDTQGRANDHWQIATSDQRVNPMVHHGRS